MASLEPPSPRGLEIRGAAETLTTGGEELGRAIWGFPFAPAWMRIKPLQILSWSIDGSGFETKSRRVG